MIENDIKDRVPTYPNRVKLTAVTGMPDTYIMSRADEPTEEGTPIDRATFQSIIQSRLTGRFYQLKCAQEYVSSDTVFTTTPLPMSEWVVDSGYLNATNGLFSISASSVASDTYSPEKAVDNDTNTYWRSAKGTEDTYVITLPSKFEVRKVKLMLKKGSTSANATASVQGSNDGKNWVNLIEIEEILTTASLLEYSVNNPGEYQHYRLVISRDVETIVSIYEFQLSEYRVNGYMNVYESDYAPIEWHAGQRIMVQTPTLSNNAVLGNTFMGIVCNTILLPLRRYELTYNGVSFDAKEV